jgi:hypothetical protein
VLGGACAILVIRGLYPDVSAAEAAELVVPRYETSPSAAALERP